MSNDFFYGSICLSDIPKDVMKAVDTKNGRKVFINVKVVERKQPSEVSKSTHFISCEPRNEQERKEGVNYFIGELTKYQPTAVTAEDIENAPKATETDLPF